MAKKAAFGTVLQYTDPDDALKTRIHYVADISGPELNVETIDVSTHDSPDHFNEFLAGSADGGEVSFELVFDSGPDGHARLLELEVDRVVLPFELIVPGGQEIIMDPGLNDEDEWSIGANWSLGGGSATYGGIAAGTEELGATLENLVGGEVYTIAITVQTEGIGNFEVAIDGNVVGLINNGGAGVTTLLYTRPDGELSEAEFTITPQASASDLELTISAISVMGRDSTKGVFAFNGLITAVGNQFPVKDAIRANCTIKVSGEPTWTRLL